MKRSKPRLVIVPFVTAALLLGSTLSSVASSQPRHAYAKPNHTLGIILDAASDLAGIQLVHGAQAAAKKVGWTVLVTDAASEPSKALTTMEDYISRGVTAILVEVFQSTTLTTGINAATKAHIPVVSWGGGLAPGVAMSSEQNGGAFVTRELLNAMGGKDQGSILAFTYHPGLPCLQREQGFNAVLKAYPNIKVTYHEINLVNATEQGESTTDAWLLTNPKPPVGVWGCYDDPSVGAVAALKELHYKPGVVKVTGVNAGPVALTDIQAGYMYGSLYFDNVASGVLLFTNITKILAEGPKWHPVAEEMPSIFVTQGTVAAFKAKYGNI